MFNKLSSLLPSGHHEHGQEPSSTETKPGTGSSHSVPATSTKKPPKRFYTVGTSTIETYFRRQLDGGSTKSLPATSSEPAAEAELIGLLTEDIVAAAIRVCKLHIGAPMPLPEDLIPILTRCITASPDLVELADEGMVEQCEISAFTSPYLLQILVATALKHRHKDMLNQLLLKGDHPKPTIFQSAGDPAQTRQVFASILDDPSYGHQAWDALVRAGWADALPPALLPTVANPLSSTPDEDKGFELVQQSLSLLKTDPEGALSRFDALIATNYNPQPYIHRTFSLLVRTGTAQMITRFLPLIPRSLYTGIPPQPKWPGEVTLVPKAAARSDAEGLAVLRALVEVGGLDVNVQAWFREGADSHPQAWDPKFADGSCADDTPLHAAVHAGNAEAVKYLLRMGANRVNDAFGRNQVQRAVFLGKTDIVEVFRNAGWTV